MKWPRKITESKIIFQRGEQPASLQWINENRSNNQYFYETSYQWKSIKRKSLDVPADAIEVRSNIWFDIFIFFFLVFSDDCFFL